MWLLLQYEADVNAQGIHGTALQAASSAGHQEVVRLLLEYGAAFDAQGMHGTALQAASSNGHEEIVQLLTKVGAQNGLHEANHVTLVKQIALWLLENGFFRSLLTKALREEVRINTFVNSLAQLIERYGENLKIARESKLLPAARCLVSHRWHIVKAILSLYSSLERNDCKDSADGQQDRVAALLHDGAFTIEGNLDKMELELSKDYLDELKQRPAFGIAPLDLFLGSVCRVVYSNPLEAVRVELLRGLDNRSGPCEVRFQLSWRIEEYLDNEIVKTKMGEIDRRIFGSLLTLSGDAHKCYANSCEV